MVGDGGHAAAPEGRSTSVAPLLLQLADWCASEAEDFDGADGAAFVVGVDARRGGGVDAFEFGAEGGEAQSAELFAQIFVGGGAGEHAVEEEFDVEVCAADDDGEDVAREAVGDGAGGEGEPVAGGEGVARVDDVDEQVRDAGAFFERGFGGADVHAAVDLVGVGGEDFAGLASRDHGVGQADGEITLAACGWADDDGVCAVHAGRGYGRGVWMVRACVVAYNLACVS